jgi:copper chaperone NosL
MKRTLVLAIALLAGSCTPVKPVAIHSGDLCFRCRRSIDQPKLAGEIVDARGRAFKFRTVKCMATYLAAHDEELKGIFAVDQTSGDFVQVESATFVPATIDSRTGEQDYLAFGSAAEATRVARTERQPTLDWPAILRAAKSD